MFGCREGSSSGVEEGLLGSSLREKEGPGTNLDAEEGLVFVKTRVQSTYIGEFWVYFWVREWFRA